MSKKPDKVISKWWYFLAAFIVVGLNIFKDDGGRLAIYIDISFIFLILLVAALFIRWLWKRIGF